MATYASCVDEVSMSQEQETALQLLDDLANQFIDNAPMIHFTVASTQPELATVYRMRYQEIIRRGWATPDEYPNQMEWDEYDQDAVHIVGRYQGTIVASTRLVFPSYNRRLPTETSFNLRVEPFRQVVDVGRTIVNFADASNKQHEIFLALTGCAWQIMRARHYAHIAAVLAPSVVRLYRMVGFEVHRLSEPRRYYGEKRCAYQFDMIQTAFNLSKNHAKHSD